MLFRDPQFHANLIMNNVYLHAIAGKTFLLEDVGRPQEDNELTEGVIRILLTTLSNAAIYVLVNRRTGASHIVVDWST